MFTFLILVVSIWVFKRFLMTYNWRFVTYSSCILTSLLSLLWLLPYYNVAGLRNGWFTIVSSSHVR